MNPLEIKDALKEIKDNFGRSTTVEQHDEESSLRHLDLATHSYYFVYSNQVDYFVRYKKVDMASYGRPYRQVLVWRIKGSNNPFTVKVAHHVFWDLLYQYSDLVSDSQQTEDGRSFWEYAIRHALETGQWVDLVNTANWESISIKTLSDFRKLMPTAWGTSSFFQRYVFVIHKPKSP